MTGTNRLAKYTCRTGTSDIVASEASTVILGMTGFGRTSPYTKKMRGGLTLAMNGRFVVDTGSSRTNSM